MDRGSKRKASTAALAASPPGDGRAAKRQKTPEPSKSSVPGEESESTKEIGMRFMKQLRGAMDKNGNLVSTEFLTLPSRKLYPEYYEETLMPLAIDTIEGKLERLEYPNVSAVESDLRRLVQNAKDFNESSSEIFQNAERIRKLTHNFMSKNNPAHKDRNYHPAPTPLPAQQIKLKTGRPSNPPLASGDIEREAENGDSQVGQRPRSKSQTQERQRSSSTAHSNVVTTVGEGHEQKLSGKSFQQAQEHLVTEMLETKDPGGDLKTFEPFANLPTRQLVDYYQVIKEPTSLKGILKRVRGIHGRQESTGVSDFKSWDAFENEVSKIWNNARTYNEDGSELYELSIELEKYFLKRLGEAKKTVAEPPQQTLKLNMSKPQPIKLKLGGQKASPGPSSDQHASAQTPLTEQSTSERRGSAVQSGVNGRGSPHVREADRISAARSPSAADQQKGSAPAESAAPNIPNGIKAEQKTSQSPAPVPAATSNQSGTPSGPPAQPNGTPVPSHPPASHPPFVPPQTGIDSKWRPEGKGAADALITNVTLSSHPSLSLPKPFTTSIPAHPKLSQQSVTLNLPHQHHALQLATTLPNSLGIARPYKLFVTVNGQRAAPSSSAAAQIANFRYTAGKRNFFDVKLMPGVNRIEIECVSISAPLNPSAQSPPTAAAASGQQGLELEKVNIFVNLLR